VKAVDFTRGGEPLEPAARPSTVETPRGLSVLYRGRFLYSRYDPQKSPVEAARAAAIPDETLVICPSPVLGYGLSELLGSIPARSFVLALEADENLMALSAERIPRDILINPKLKLIRTASVARVIETVDALGQGPFRRVVRLDLSGGAALNLDFYREVQAGIEEYISRWWRNHVTLMRLGRNYARNFFSNCHSLPASFALPAHTITRPIVVAGAGPSLDGSLRLIAENRERIFLLAVDTALPALRDSGIVPDAAVLVESQFWITRAFIGFRGSRLPVYADLTANPEAALATGGPLHFFHTAYANARFLTRFAGYGLSPQSVTPLGSVGLSALELALAVSAPEVPILFTGLDFSWGTGFTHSRGAPASLDAFARGDRLSPAERSAISDSPAIATVIGKDGAPARTDPALSGYAALCAARFGSEGRLFDFGSSGIPTGCALVSTDETRSMIAGFAPSPLPDRTRASVDESRLTAFLAEEKGRLRAIRAILTGQDAREDGEADRLREYVEESDYLYLHFPDGYRGYSASDAFLRRIRIELEYFLKTIEHPRAIART
jgi:hypothetical protein